MGCRVMQRPFIVSVGFVHKKRGKARRRTFLRQRVLSARRQMSERI